MDKLLIEVVEKVFSFSLGKLLKLYRLVCCKWNIMERRYLFRNITIAGHEVGLMYLKSFKISGVGEHVQNITLTKKSGVTNNKILLSLPIPFELADDMYSRCHNLLQIRMVDINVYYLLKNLDYEIQQNWKVLILTGTHAKSLQRL